MAGRVVVLARTVLCGLAAVLILSSLGCGGAEKPPPLFPVSGKVTYQGKAVPGAKLMFIPADEDPKNPSLGRRASGETDADGAYELWWGKDQVAGCPAGQFKVVIFAYQDLGDKADDEVKPPSLIPEIYNSPATSGLLKTVNEDENEIDFNLEGQVGAAGQAQPQKLGPRGE
ncbi:MAG TPA: hypothetical protein VGH74_09255 [Planctomycetaceae bacterium]